MRFLLRALRNGWLVVSCAIAAACGSSGGDKPSVVEPPETIEPPTQLDSLGTWQAILAGSSHTCGLTKDNAAYCWGWGERGELGNGSTKDSFTPVPVSGGLRFKVLAVGKYRSCGITVQGDSYCWGSGDALVPTRLGGAVRYTAVALDDAYTCALAVNGAVDCWGPYADFQITPRPVSSTARFTSIFGGVDGSAICGLTAEGSAYCWGNLGNDPLVAVRQPATVPLVSLTANGVPGSPPATHFCGLDSAGVAYCWGINTDGQLGNGTTARSDTASVVRGGLRFMQLGSRWGATVGLATDGTLYYWGTWINKSTLPSRLFDRKLAQVSVGFSHMCGVTSRGAGYCWGGNSRGVLGNGVDGPFGQLYTVPVRVPDPT